MSQTKKSSFLESAVNVLIGYFVALGSQLIVFPIFDILVPLSTNIGIGAWFTAISLTRSYVIRRVFNRALK